MSVATGCGCKEVYRFPHTTYPYSSCICSFLQLHPYFLLIFYLCFSFLVPDFFVIKFYVLIFFSCSINTHTGNYRIAGFFREVHIFVGTRSSQKVKSRIFTPL